MSILSLKYSGWSGDEVQDDIKTTIYLVTYTILVDTTVNPGR